MDCSFIPTRHGSHNQEQVLPLCFLSQFLVSPHLPLHLGTVFPQSGLLVTVVQAVHWTEPRQRGQWRLKASLCWACRSLLAGAGSGAPREGSISNPHKGALPAGITVPPANTLSLLLRPSLPFTPGGRGREWSVCKSPQYKVVWGHWPDSHLPSSPSLDSSSFSPSCLFQSLLHRHHSLRKGRLRLKEENYSLHDTCASSVKSRTDEREPAEFSSLPPPLNPSLKLREKLWKRAAHKQCLSNSHRTETTGDHCLLPQMWGWVCLAGFQITHLL